MTNKLVASVILPALLGVLASNVLADRAMRVQDAIWAHDRIYDTILTDTNFKSPPAHSTDVLYNFGMSGLMGQRAVAEYAPGDRHYNGGRWDVKLVMFTTQGLAAHDPDGDGTANFELTNATAVLAHVELGHITIMDANHYFECPLLR